MELHYIMEYLAIYIWIVYLNLDCLFYSLILQLGYVHLMHMVQVFIFQQ